MTLYSLSTMNRSVVISVIYVRFSQAICDTVCLSILTTIFQMNVGYPMFIEGEDDGSGGDHWSFNSFRAPIESAPTNRHPVSLQAGCRSCRPNNRFKALTGKISPAVDLLIPNSRGVFQLCLWPLVVSGCLGGGLPRHSSALWFQYPKLLISDTLCNLNVHFAVTMTMLKTTANFTIRCWDTNVMFTYTRLCTLVHAALKEHVCRRCIFDTLCSTSKLLYNEAWAMYKGEVYGDP